MALTTFVDVVSAVPTLRNSCSVALSSEAPGSGLKMMRLVSKQIQAAMLGAVAGYTLCLDGNAHSLICQAGMLQGTKLSCLRVIVNDHANYVFPGGLDEWNNHARHVQCFVCRMGSAICSIVCLELTSECKDSKAVEGVSALLSLFAPSCPALQQLRVTGNIGRGVLSTFGASCQRLSFLEVMSGVRSDTLQQLHSIMPSLTHCTVAAPPEMEFDIPEAGSCCMALLSCVSLSFLDVGFSQLSLSMWLALPATLSKLCCALPELPYADLIPLQHLQHLMCHCPSQGICLASLVAVVRAAVGLKCVTVREHVVRKDPTEVGIWSSPYVSVPCDSAIIPDLVYLHKRVSAGLCLNALRIKDDASKELSLQMWDNGFEEHLHADQAHRCNLGYFMASLPPFPLFTRLVVWASFEHNSLSSFTSAASIAFPKLAGLTLDLCAPIKSSDLIHLKGFTSLQELTLENANVTPMAVAILCNHVPSLKLVQLACDDIAPADGLSLRSLLHLWRSNVTCVQK